MKGPIMFRTTLRMVSCLLCLTLASSLTGTAHSEGPPATAPSTPAAVVPAAPSTAPANACQQFVGRWLRPDGGYILTIQDIADNRTVTAAYNNPNPINVSRAHVATSQGQTLLYVELRDRGYPGNYYTLKYDPGSDQLVGVYCHLGLGRKFEVFFERLRMEASREE